MSKCLVCWMIDVGFSPDLLYYGNYYKMCLNGFLICIKLDVNLIYKVECLGRILFVSKGKESFI